MLINPSKSFKIKSSLKKELGTFHFVTITVFFKTFFCHIHYLPFIKSMSLHNRLFNVISSELALQLLPQRSCIFTTYLKEAVVCYMNEG